jgi:hypothetical protein
VKRLLEFVYIAPAEDSSHSSTTTSSAHNHNLFSIRTLSKKESFMNDIIDLIRLADPADSNSVIDKSDPRAQAILQQVVSHHNDRSPATAKRRRVSRRKFVVASVAAVAGVLGLLQSPFGGMPTANAAVRSAVSRSIGAPSGRAVVHINVTGSTNKLLTHNPATQPPSLNE